MIFEKVIKIHLFFYDFERTAPLCGGGVGFGLFFNAFSMIFEKEIKSIGFLMFLKK